MRARQPDPEPERSSEEDGPHSERANRPADSASPVTRIDARLLFPGWGPKLWK